MADQVTLYSDKIQVTIKKLFSSLVCINFSDLNKSDNDVMLKLNLITIQQL